MALPFLPGNQFNRNLGKGKYHKSHHFDIANEVKMNIGEAKPGIGGDPLPGGRLPPPNSSIPRGNGPAMPTWVAFDRQVLSFDAYYQEAVHERREEQYRIRECKIYFYLEDDSIQVTEPRLKNAGMPQGTLVRRHRIPRPPPRDEEFYTVEDFNVGSEITFYGKTFKMTGCDEFTVNFLQKLGVRIKPCEAIPGDPYSSHRKALEESMQALRPYERQDTLKQFLDHDRHVLRFYCYWDDREEMFGDRRNMILHYFLADDTMEIREAIPANAGRDAVPTFLHRCKLPKMHEQLLQPGEVADRTVLNVFGPTGKGGRYIYDSLKTGNIEHDYYTDADFTPGAALNVYGRRFVICDADDFTKAFYKTKYGIIDFGGMPLPKDVAVTHKKEIPPYNGFGGEEDTLNGCLNLLPKPPKKDFIKFMEKDRRGLDSNVLRFHACLQTKKPIDAERRFIISYYLSDDTILVFEPTVRNSGIVSGKFLERGRIKKQNQERYPVELPDYYTYRDLYVGALVNFNGFKFCLLDADEYAYDYMERHKEEFSAADPVAVLQKLAAIVYQGGGSAGGESGYMSFEQFCASLRNMSCCGLTQHEIRTLARFYQDNRNDGLDLKTLVSIAQEQLRKQSFEDFHYIYDNCLHLDRERSGCLHADAVRSVFKSLKVPISDDLLRQIMARVAGNGENIDYETLINMLNWRKCPAEPVTTMTASAMASTTDGWKGTATSAQISSVNMGQLQMDLQGMAPSGPSQQTDCEGKLPENVH